MKNYDVIYINCTNKTANPAFTPDIANMIKFIKNGTIVKLNNEISLVVNGKIEKEIETFYLLNFSDFKFIDDAFLFKRNENGNIDSFNETQMKVYRSLVRFEN